MLPRDKPEVPAVDDPRWTDVTTTVPSGNDPRWQDVKGTGGVLGNVPDESDLSGFAKNVGSTVTHGLSHVVGAAGDLWESGRQVAAMVKSAWDPRTRAQIIAAWDKENAADHEAFLKKWGPAVEGMKEGPLKEGLMKQLAEARARQTAAPMTGAEFHETSIAPKTGDYKPQTWAGRAFRAVGETAIPMIAGPGGLGGGRAILGGGATGLATQQAEEIFPGSNVPLITSLALPFAGKGVGVAAEHYFPGKAAQASDAARKLVGTMTSKDRGKTLADATTQYEKEDLPGLKGTKTLGELTKDPGLVDLEQAVRAEAAPVTREKMAAQEEQRAGARVEAAKGTLNASDPDSVARFFEERQKQLDEAAGQVLTDTRPPGERGTALQEEASGHELAIKGRTSRLYDAIDPDNQLRVLTPGVRGAVKAIEGEHMEGFTDPPGKEVQGLLDRTKTWSEVVGFNQLSGYLKAINARLKSTQPTALSAGDPATHRQYTILKKAVVADMNNAVANQAAREAQLVAQGKMAEADTLAARMKALEAGEPAGPVSAVPGEPNLTPEAVGALKAAQASRVEQGQLFDNKVVRNIIGAGESDVGGLPAKAFPGGDKGYEITKQVLDATNRSPEAIKALQDTAIEALKGKAERQTTAAGTTTLRIDGKQLQKFRDDYATSLKALDEVSPGFSSRFDNVANIQSELAQRFLDEKSRGVGTGSARETVGRLLKDKVEGPAKLQALLEEAGGDVNVQEGLKHLVVENMFGMAMDDIAGQPQRFNGSKFLALMKDNRDALAKLFPEEQMKIWEAIARDFDSELTHKNVALRGALRTNSATATNLSAIERAFADEKGAYVPREGAAPAIVGGHLGGPWGAVAGAAWNIGRNFVGRFLHDARQAGIKNRNDLIRAGVIDGQVGLRMIRQGLEEVGSDTWMARVAHGLEQSPYYATPAMVEGAKDRKKHATGGKVSAEHIRAAQHMVGLVARARRSEQDATKPLLRSNDSMVASALAAASRGI